MAKCLIKSSILLIPILTIAEKLPAITKMKFKYYQNTLGGAQLCGGEMHASLHEIVFDEEFLNCKNEFIEQLKIFINSTERQPEILKKHLGRGFNISNDERTCLIDYPDFPLKSVEKGYFNPKFVEFGLSGGDIGWYKPNCLEEEYYFFYETKHPFSQWNKSEFQIDGLTFNSAEQYMMYGKAKLFDNKEITEKIMASKNVREQKKLGREVKNFDLEIWNENAIDIVYKGNKAKFEQNADYLKLLLSTKGKTLVEAIPTDKTWGIGLTADDIDAKNILKWKGTNWLGIALTELRQEFLENNYKNGYWEREDYIKNKEEIIKG
ncbi:NADAR family protein [Aquimarina sp. 2-A2]|uniref:NADAR family protein n=1 Tax=Aquimarina sp. 2-A2 TaxID=3382644 RepID=UPI00387F31F4